MSRRQFQLFVGAVALAIAFHASAQSRVFGRVVLVDAKIADQGVSDARVSVRTADGVVVGRTITDSNGNYSVPVDAAATAAVLEVRKIDHERNPHIQRLGPSVAPQPKVLLSRSNAPSTYYATVAKVLLELKGSSLSPEQRSAYLTSVASLPKSDLAAVYLQLSSASDTTTAQDLLFARRSSEFAAELDRELTDSGIATVKVASDPTKEFGYVLIGTVKSNDDSKRIVGIAQKVATQYQIPKTQFEILVRPQ